MILITCVCVCVCVVIPFIVCVCMCLLNCTQPRNPALSPQSFFAPRIDPPKEGSVILIPKTSDQTRQRGVCVCVCVYVCVDCIAHNRAIRP